MRSSIECLSLRSLVASIAIAFAIVAAPARAEEEDHLKCYKIQDPAKFSASVEIRNWLGIENCLLASPAKLFCEQTVKFRCHPSGNACATNADCPGTEICADDPRGDRAHDYLCYRIKACLGALPPNTAPTDQFGARTISFKGAQHLCVQANKFVCGDGNVDPGEDCDLTDDANCPGACNPDCTCPPPTTTSTTTTTTTVPFTCTAATPHPNCDGTCAPDALCGDPMSTGFCVCMTGIVPCGVMTPPFSAPNCWGNCTAPLVCRNSAGTCACAP